MEGLTKARRKVVKPQVEVSVDSFLWRLANRKDSSVIIASVMVAMFLLGMLTAWWL